MKTRCHVHRVAVNQNAKLVTFVFQVPNDLETITAIQGETSFIPIATNSNTNALIGSLLIRENNKARIEIPVYYAGASNSKMSFHLQNALFDNAPYHNATKRTALVCCFRPSQKMLSGQLTCYHASSAYELTLYIYYTPKNPLRGIND